MYNKFGKRLTDAILSFCMLVVLSPLLAVIAVIVRLDCGSSPVFVQKRIGKNKKIIRVAKFKSMRDDAPHDVATADLADPDRYMTRTGHFLRRTSLDELLQLWNIFKGDMSFVGPRPALWNQYNLIDLREKAGVNALTPGLTGWAQINGRDTLTDEEKTAFDKQYLDAFSLKMDLRCFFGTFMKVLRQDDIHMKG